jgi:protein O-GlcNAc transferase
MDIAIISVMLTLARKRKGELNPYWQLQIELLDCQGSFKYKNSDMAHRSNKRKIAKKSNSKRRSTGDDRHERRFSPRSNELNDAMMMHRSGQLAEAETIYRRILEDDPNHSDALHLLGVLASQAGRHDLAVRIIHQAIAISPNNAIYYLNLGHVFKNLNQLQDAIWGYENALGCQPDNPDALSQLAHLLQKTCAWQKLNGLSEELDAATKDALNSGTKPAESPYINVTRHADPNLNFLVSKSWADDISMRISKVNCSFSPGDRCRRKSKITVGYLSNDFRHHPIAHLTGALFGLHNRNEVKVYGYSYGINDGSWYRERIRRDCDKFVDLRHMSFVDAAKRICEDQVDILVDLMGHTTGNRLEICALRPAPIQVSYLGFPGTSGADFFDYLITDIIVTPERHFPYYSEKIVYMPHCYQINDQTQSISKQRYLRKDFGLPEDKFVFGSFVQAHKIEPVMFDIWMNVLRDVPESVLWLFSPHEMVANNLRQAAEKRGILTDRLIFAEKLPKDEHLARHRLANLFLDTRIYNGHTSTSDALWAGVPVVTLLGNHFASRVSASILTALGLPELIVSSLEEYQTLAVRLAHQHEALDEIRQRLIRNRKTAPLFDTPRFVLNLEKAYKQMWDIYLNGEMPRHLAIEERRHPIAV